MEAKIKRAIKIIKMAAKDQQIEVCYSGGKDSEVILELAKMAEVNCRPIYRNTTIDPPHTISHVKSKGVEIVRPKRSFFECVQYGGMPTRRARMCCQFLKEYKIMDRAIQGIRACESMRRKARYNLDDPIICRIYGSKKNNVQVALPILDWSDKDVSQFITERKIQCHPDYYDEWGAFHVKRRLGCIGCPLRSDNGRAELLQYPKFFRQLAKSTKIWWETHPNVSSRRKFPDVYALIAHNLFFKFYSDWQCADNTFFGHTDWKQYLEEYFKIDLL